MVVQSSQVHTDLAIPHFGTIPDAHSDGRNLCKAISKSFKQIFEFSLQSKERKTESQSTAYLEFLNSRQSIETKLLNTDKLQ